MKLYIVKWFDNGQSKGSISRALGLNETTVGLILLKSNEYKEQGKVASTSFSIRCTRNRSSILVEMENLLITWLEDFTQKRIPVWYQQHNGKSTWPVFIAQRKQIQRGYHDILCQQRVV
jgi:hypothetical protein